MATNLAVLPTKTTKNASETDPSYYLLWRPDGYTKANSETLVVSLLPKMVKTAAATYGPSRTAFNLAVLPPTGTKTNRKQTPPLLCYGELVILKLTAKR
jgi:hypothetical protein